MKALTKTNLILGLTTVGLAASLQADCIVTGGYTGMNLTIPDLGLGVYTNTMITVEGDLKVILDVNVRLDIGAAVGDAVWNGDLYAQLTHVDPQGNTKVAVLINRVGRGAGGLYDLEGYWHNGLNIIFDDQAKPTRPPSTHQAN